MPLQRAQKKTSISEAKKQQIVGYSYTDGGIMMVNDGQILHWWDNLTKIVK